jgi:hypothetical protein
VTKDYRVGLVSFMNASRSRTTHSGRSQCTEWPVFGHTFKLASGIASASRSWSSREKTASCSPTRSTSARRSRQAG